MIKLRWILFISKRFATVDTKGRSAVTNYLSVFGIGFGVMTLIIIMGVMNGFQSGFINSILEVNSSHIRIEKSGNKPDEDIIELPGKINEIVSVLPVLETQTLIEGGIRKKQQGIVLRAVPEFPLTIDKGLASAVTVPRGDFDLATENSIVLGSELASYLGVALGDKITILALTGGTGTDLFPDNCEFTLSGVFKSGYYEIDSSFAFINLKDAVNLFYGGNSNSIYPFVYNIKLKDKNNDLKVLSVLKSLETNECKIQSWREYNRVFFGALKIEKNMMLILVFIIFVVVSVNIFHGMRRSIYDRREESGVLRALGASPYELRLIFLLNGILTGITGTFIGLVLGLLVGNNIAYVFHMAESVVNGIMYFLNMLLSGTSDGMNSFKIFNPVYFYMTDVHVVFYYKEILLISIFGIGSALVAALRASRDLLGLKAVEVLQYE